MRPDLCLCFVSAMLVGAVRAGAAEPPKTDSGTSSTTASSSTSAQSAPAAQTSPAEPSSTPEPTAAPSRLASPAPLEELVVTGSRITAQGFTQPTPTTMLSAPDIEKVAEPNLFTAIAELPALQGSTGRTTFANSTSSGMQGLSSFSLRNLGTIRTLTLLDGQRVTPANITNVADVSQFPQLLMKRVDVVTGGASASYGSDAIGGVVNFVTDTKFVGFKSNVEAGETTYHDDKNLTAQAAWGQAFANDRLHVEFSGEYSKEGGVPPGPFGVGPGAGGRTWFTSPAIQIRPISQTTDGLPQYIVIQNAQQYQYAKYGLITSGLLQGTAFGVNGAPYTFLYGSNGVPTRNGTGQVTGCYSPFCVGGDLSGDVGQTTSLAADLKRTVGYLRLGWDVGDSHEVFFTTNLAQVTSVNEPNAGAEKTANLSIHCDNPFLPASIQAQCAAQYPTGVMGFGTSNGEFLPNAVNVHAKRTLERFVAGVDGTRFLGTNWSYNGYYEHGTNKTDIDVHDISLTPRYNAAIDAMVGPNGTIVCRSATAQASGCVPLNIIGQVTVDPAALAYVLPGNGPQQRVHQNEDVVSFNLSGEPFSLWAGPVDLATGAEYRNESYVTRADPYGNGITADSPSSAAYPADPMLNPNGNNWYAGNYHDGQGSYHVEEAYLEESTPILKWAPVGEINLNAAIRQTKYSTSGNVTAWKVGATWKTPLDGLRLRAVTSRDIRAPNLSELFAPTVVVNATVVASGKNITVLGETVGNPNLKPEIARNTTFGIVLSQPDFLPGFSASIDYYDIRIDNEISTLTAQQEVDLCAAGNLALCSQMLLTSTAPNTNYVRVQAFNLATVRDEGYDIEAMYRTHLTGIGLPGSLTVRGLATRAISFLTNSGIIGTIPVQSAGVNQGTSVNSGGIPFWKTYFTEGWDTDKFSFNFTERWFSDGVYAREYIQCTSNCPVSTVVHTTINNNVMKGATYVDFGATYSFSDKMTAYVKVDNLFNVSPVPAPQTSVFYGANPFLYDVLGRMYRVGFRTGF